MRYIWFYLLVIQMIILIFLNKSIFVNRKKSEFLLLVYHVIIIFIKKLLKWLKVKLKFVKIEKI